MHYFVSKGAYRRLILKLHNSDTMFRLQCRTLLRLTGFQNTNLPEEFRQWQQLLLYLRLLRQLSLPLRAANPPGLWAVEWVGFVNMVNNPTQSSNRQVSDKIMTLHNATNCIHIDTCIVLFKIILQL